ncbi:MAG: aldo/keto reductase, partial [Rhodococcus sp. (in: high G+C Gram-positive bacteria)]
IAQGVLTGKYLPGQPLPEGSRATDDKGGDKMISRYLEDETLTRVQKLAPIAADLGITMAQLAVAWVLANDNVAAALVGASRPEQIAENVKASEVVLDAEVLGKIDDALAGSIITDPKLTRSPDARL